MWDWSWSNISWGNHGSAFEQVDFNHLHVLAGPSIVKFRLFGGVPLSLPSICYVPVRMILVPPNLPKSSWQSLILFFFFVPVQGPCAPNALFMVVVGIVTGWCDFTSPVNWEQTGNFMLWYYSVLVVSCLAPLHVYHYSTERLPCISCIMGNTGWIGTCRMLEFGALTEYWGNLTKVLYISYLIVFECIHHIDFALEHDLFLRSSLVFPVNNWMTGDEYTI